MTNFMFIVLIAIVVILVVIFLNSSFGKQLRVKLKGRTDEVMRQDASTPEGAKDYYNAAIRDKEEFYNKASTTYAEISGRLDSAEKDLYNANKEIMRITKEINACLDNNDENSAMQYAMKKETVENKIKVLKDTIEEMKQAKMHQEEIRNQASSDLQKLKKRKKNRFYSRWKQIVRLLNSIKVWTV